MFGLPEAPDSGIKKRSLPKPPAPWTLASLPTATDGAMLKEETSMFQPRSVAPVWARPVPLTDLVSGMLGYFR